MTISATYERLVYHRCWLSNDCGRRYCREHRLLYRDCDTIQRGLEGDRDATNGVHMVLESNGECPECLVDSRYTTALNNSGGLL